MKISKKFVPLLITLAVVLLASITTKDDFKTLLPFALIILVFSIYRLDVRILIGSAISLLLLTAVLTSQKAADSAKEAAVLSYWLLIAGVVCIVIELCRGSLRKQEVYQGNTD